MEHQMTPDELTEVLKRYQRESNQSERKVASQIGVNHHTVNRWLRDAQCPSKGTAGVSRFLSQARRLPVGVGRRRQVYAPTDLARRMPSDWQTVVNSIMVKSVC
jgi:transposase-like protein